MTNQEKIAYLKKYKVLDNEINRLLEEKEIWYSRATKITQTISDMPRGGNGEDGRQNAIHKMIDAETEATKKIDELVDLGREIKSAIETLDSIEQRLLLNLRYIDGKTFEEIAVIMSYSWRHIHRLHKNSLSILNMS